MKWSSCSLAVLSMKNYILNVQERPGDVKMKHDECNIRLRFNKNWEEIKNENDFSIPTSWTSDIVPIY